jgi:hypothetical protein
MDYREYRREQQRDAAEQRRYRLGQMSFGKQVAMGMATVGIVTFLAAPSLQSAWAGFTASPEERQRVERSVHYAGCDEARAAGVAPISRGSPGYRTEMDGDSDGIACEPVP